MKVTVIGAGNVGATCAKVIANRELADEVILIDIKEGLSEGKSLDMWETSPVLLYDTRVKGYTNDYSKTKDSEVVVITSGLPRKPGMSRDDLISTNANIVKEVTENVVKYSPNAKIIVVSNPLDVMAYTALLASKKPSTEVFGMAGILDTARFKSFISMELNISPKDISALIMGGHGDTMVALPRYSSIAGIPLTQMIEKDKLDAIIQRTVGGGGELVKLMGTSAWYAPGAGAAQMVEVITRNQKRLLPVSAWLQGEYGISDIYFGVPVILGKNGIEKIIEIDLNDEEREMINKSAEAVKVVKEVLDGMKLF
ncbi:MAG: malate dehydrogenase [Bacteroidota bacterium]|nr:malate dehydrogenase [Bacteroidota bacterium]